MKKILIIIAISLAFASCKKDEATSGYDNAPLTNTRWRANNITLSFTSTHVTETYANLSPITKPYFLSGDRLYFYSMSNSASVKIELFSNKQTLIYNIYPNGGYEYYLQRY